MEACRQTNATLFVTGSAPRTVHRVLVPVVHRAVRDSRRAPRQGEVARLLVGKQLLGREHTRLLPVPDSVASGIEQAPGQMIVSTDVGHIVGSFRQHLNQSIILCDPEEIQKQASHWPQLKCQLLKSGISWKNSDSGLGTSQLLRAVRLTYKSWGEPKSHM
jgi:hypothetical protein